MKGMLILENEEGSSTSDSQWFSKIYALTLKNVFRIYEIPNF